MQPRLLTLSEAAAYLGMCESTFRTIAPVEPVDFGAKHTRLKRYDLKLLDQWLDRQAGIANDDGLTEMDKWLQENGSRSA
jgi:phage terminase Nu1 subunit (DNA packaging protein)